MSTERDRGSGSDRSVARLSAVQALYQLAMRDDESAAAIAEEFVAHRLSQPIDGEMLAKADQAHFRDILTGAGERLSTIDAALEPALADGWRLERMDRLLVAILRAAVYELIARPDIPTKVVLNEYVEVAKAFYSSAEVRLVNAVLDKVSKVIRA